MAQSSADEELVFLSTRGDRLSGVFYPCRTPALAETHDTVLLVHGLMSEKNVSILRALGTALSEHVTCFAFDFPGQGASEGEFEYGGYQRQVDEVQHVIQWLHSQHQRKTVAVIGHSMGGNVVLLHAALCGTVPLVVNLSARHYLDKGILAPSKAADVAEFEASGQFTLRRKGKTFVIRKESIAERLRTSMSVCSNIAPHIRLLTLHGDADEIIPHADSVALHHLLMPALVAVDTNAGVGVGASVAPEHTPRHTFVTVSGSDHGYSKAEHATAAVEAVLQWLLPQIAPQ